MDIPARPTRRTRNKHGGRKPSVEERLLAAMERMLEQGQGFASLTVEGLAIEAGMSRGTFYSHFKDKNELVGRLVGLVTDEIVESAGTWLATREGGDKPRREDLEATMLGVSRTFTKHRAILAAFNETAQHDSTLGEQYQKMMDTICQRCHQSVVAVNGGVDSPAVKGVADALSWFVVMYLGRFSPMMKGKELERLVKSAAHVCGSAIFAVDKVR